MKHIEDNECCSGWTIKHLNELAYQCYDLEQFIIPDRGVWFVAGAPPLKPDPTDFSPHNNLYVCPVCHKEYGRGHELREHLKGRECSHGYPSVLRCPGCPHTGFERLSQLFEHLEWPGCQSNRRSVARLVERIKRNFEDPRVRRDVQQMLERDPIWLQFDENLRILRLARYSYDDEF